MLAPLKKYYTDRYIVHVDMDAFFASVEQRDNPGYRKKPVIVGADPKGGTGRGVVSACSYRARKYGVHSAMPISVAYRKCPGAVFLPVRMEKYTKVSREIFEILQNFTPQIEKISIDEAFLDITGSYHLFGTPEKTARRIKKEIKTQTGLTASLGLAPNKFIAKIGSDFDKPDGLTVVKKNKIKEFLFPLDVEKIWGVGEKTAAALKKMGIRTVKELAQKDKGELYDKFGKRGLHFWRLARGIDNRKIETFRPVKSVSHEYTFEKNSTDGEKIKAVLLELSGKVSRRLRDKGLKGRTVSLKIRLTGFNTFTRDKTIEYPLDSTETIFKSVLKLYGEFTDKREGVRLLGVKVSNFSKGQKQMDLFNKGPGKEEKKLDGAMDKLRKKYGTGTLYRAGIMLSDKDRA
ncbi:MAG: DNA polymerase IV [Elusimicrobiota bacterium]